MKVTVTIPNLLIDKSPKEIKEVKSPEKIKELYDKSAITVFEIMNDTKKEWWPTEGTLIGILRYGQNFDLANYSFSPIGTDTDIDIMIRVDDDTEWEKLKINLIETFKKKGWADCYIFNVNEKGDKLTCYTKHSIGEYFIHTDIHRYQVNEEDNYAYMTKSSELKYPFQHWGNKIEYKGGIVDDDGQLGVALYDNMEVPCPLNAVSLLSHWNGGEYAESEIRWPYSGIHKTDNGFLWIDNFEVNITEQDKTKLRKRWAELHEKGYMSFIENKELREYK